MNILFLADYGAAHIGAFGNSVISLSEELLHRGHDIRFVFSGNGPLPERLRTGWNVECGVIEPHSRWNRSLWDAVVRVTGNWRPDAVHVNFGQASLLAGLKARPLFGSKLIWHVRGFLRKRTGAGRMMSKLYYRTLSRRVDSIVCISRALADDLISRGYADPSKLTVIHNGVAGPVEGACYDDPEITGNLRKLDAVWGQIFGMVANFGAEKDHETLFTAFANVLGRFDRAVLVLAGEGMRGEETEQRAGIDGMLDRYGIRDRVVLAGRVDPVWGAISPLTAGVLVSGTEGFGNVAAEYGLMGKPSIVSNSGGLPEIVENGVTGFVIPQGDSSSLAGHMASLVSDPEMAGRMGSAARARVSKLFSMKKWVSAMVDHYGQVTGIE